MQTPSYLEDHVSQIPAIQLLVKMGYQYLTPEDVEKERKGKTSEVVLEKILESQLHKINSIEFRGERFSFSTSNIYQAIQALKDFPLKDGLNVTNEKVFDLITLGKSFEEVIGGDKKSFTLQYIDWRNPENNVYHLVEEYCVERTASHQTRRPDIVLFVNGIPLVVIECKRPDLKTGDNSKPHEQAVSQHLRNQHEREIPKLYIYSQLLLALSVSEAVYATTATPREFWSVWKERGIDNEIQELKNRKLPSGIKDLIFKDRNRAVKLHFEELEEESLMVSEQDRALYTLCRKDRLIEMVRQFIVFDNGIKKIARYQQYFAVKKTMERIVTPENGKRQGGVIWHTQGSGKSLTMVMLAKAIALEPSIINPRIVLVTDRVDLDDQLYKTFDACDLPAEKARTGKHLLELIKGQRASIITTLVQKFEAALKKGTAQDNSSEIFVLVDESHRSHYGSANVKMQQTFPNACYIGFTGTPLKKKDKNTIKRFGGIIDDYTIEKAVADKAIVPLLYEGRHVNQEVNEKIIDSYFNRISEPLTPYQRSDLKKKFSRADQLNEADQKILRTAWDISTHYRETWKGTPYKGQITVPSKAAAIKYKKYLDEIKIITSELIISPPDSREGHEDIYDEAADEVQQFWNKMMKKYGNEKQYNKSIINSFKHDEHPEVLIVVDKLLTGFDAPRNTVLYICRSLKEHSLLQAIARVNRLFEGKDFGYIIDYYGVLGDLSEALDTYSSLSDFDEEDLEGTLVNINEEVEKLAERHSHVWDLFKTVKNKRDQEAYALILANKDDRDEFYERLSLFARTLKLALSTLDFIENTPPEKVDLYKMDAKFFLKLRADVKQRYSDAIDYKQYEKQIQKLIDTHISSEEVIQITEQVNIFEREEFEKEVEKVEGKAAKADIIASRTAKTISEKMDEDPVFYKRFSKLLQETIDAFHMKRISEAEYLSRVTKAMNQVISGSDESEPEIVKNKENAKAYYRIVKDEIKELGEEKSAEVGLRLDNIIEANKIVDWKRKNDVQKRMEQTMEDYLYDLRNDDLLLSFDQIDAIIGRIMAVAIKRG
jgi:type I restriction enzyme, R subunit